jgi:hypothetical protein
MVWPARGPLRLLFGLLKASVNIRRFGFCFVQFREYFLCNFSKTQKQQKTGNWHCGIRKMHKNATKCNKTLSKWCKNKHGASKIIDTFETYQGAEGSRSRDPFLPVRAHGEGQGVELFARYVVDGMNERGPTILAHASEAVGREARDARVFLYFLVAGMVPPMSLFLHAALSTYSVVLAHLHPNTLLTLASF